MLGRWSWSYTLHGQLILAPVVELGHKDGRCSFESILLESDLQGAALAPMAKIVHAADVAADMDTDPVARGLEAIAAGYSLHFPEDEEDLPLGARHWVDVSPVMQHHDSAIVDFSPSQSTIFHGIAK